MFLRQFYVESLGHYSYLIGSLDAGVGFAVDPKRDVADYVDAADTMGLRITHILETHLHNDYVSGARQLAAATGATIGHSAAAGLAYPHQPLHEGDILRFGELEVRVLETPGHTPEHLAYVLYDTDRSREIPALILSGGDLLVGSVGRPDLLGPELGRTLAPQLYDSLHDKILRVGDATQVLPTHGAGSSCGAAISTSRTSTVGYEKATNPYLQAESKDAFVAAVLHGQPAVPAYYRRMRPTNQQGPRVMEAFPRPAGLAPPDFAEALRAGDAVALDTRLPAAFGGAHVPGAINVALDSIFATWAGSIVPPDRPIFLITERTEDVEEVVRQLMRIGLETIPAFLRGGLMAWTEAGLPVDMIPQISAQELRDDVDGPRALQPLDVRRDEEWQEGHISGALHIVGNDIPDQMERLPRDRPIAVVCGSGYRSSVAASLLQRAGFADVRNVIGGMSAWNALNYRTERHSPAPAGSNGRRGTINIS